MVEKKLLVCHVNDLKKNGMSYKYEFLDNDKNKISIFLINFNGKIYGYKNICAHLPVSLDWDNNLFFDNDKKKLICSTHGAKFNPESGLCIYGPCFGKKLTKIKFEKCNDKIYLTG